MTANNNASHAMSLSIPSGTAVATFKVNGTTGTNTAAAQSAWEAASLLAHQGQTDFMEGGVWPIAFGPTTAD